MRARTQVSTVTVSSWLVHGALGVAGCSRSRSLQEMASVEVDMISVHVRPVMRKAYIVPNNAQFLHIQ